MSTDADTADHPPSANYVLDVLEAADRPLTQTEIAEQIHFARNTVSIALRELADEGLVASTDAPALADDRGGRPPRRYRLVG